MTSEARSILSRDTHVDEPTLRRLLAEAVARIEALEAGIRNALGVGQVVGDSKRQLMKLLES